MKPPAGSTYKSEWQRLAVYLHTQWPGLRLGSTVDTTIWLLEYLRTIEMSGILPSYDCEGTLVRTVGAAAAVAQLVRQEGERVQKLSATTPKAGW